MKPYGNVVGLVAVTQSRFWPSNALSWQCSASSLLCELAATSLIGTKLNVATSKQLLTRRQWRRTTSRVKILDPKSSPCPLTCNLPQRALTKSVLSFPPCGGALAFPYPTSFASASARYTQQKKHPSVIPKALLAPLTKS